MREGVFEVNTDDLEEENFYDIDQESVMQSLENIVQIENGQMFTTSLIVAKAFDKRHKNVLRDIENLECSQEFRGLNFEHTPFVHPQNGKTYPAYRLTRDGFAFLAMGFTGKKAAAWKETFLAAFNAMEKILNQRIEDKKTEQGVKELKRQPKSEFFSSAKLLDPRLVASLRGILQMESLIQKCPAEILVQELLLCHHVESLEMLPEYSYYSVVLSILLRMFRVQRRQGSEATLSPEFKAAIEGMSCFWAVVNGSSKSEIDSYVKNRCGILPEEAASDDDGLKVLFALWGGFSNHNLHYRGW